MTINNLGGIHAFVSGSSTTLRGGIYDEFPETGIPYGYVLLADMDGGKELTTHTISIWT